MQGTFGGPQVFMFINYYFFYRMGIMDYNHRGIEIEVILRRLNKLEEMHRDITAAYLIGAEPHNIARIYKLDITEIERIINESLVIISTD